MTYSKELQETTAMNTDKQMQLEIDDQKPTTELKSKRTRQARPYPAGSFEDSLEFAKHIYRLAAGQPIRRLTLFDELSKSPDSGTSRQLIVNSGKYGLTKGSYNAEYLELTPAGYLACSEESSVQDRTKAKIQLAIDEIQIFKFLYDKFVGNKLPAKQVLVDAAKSQSLSNDLADELVDIFIVNLRTLGLLQTLSGSDRIVGVQHLLDSLPISSGTEPEKVQSFSSIQILSESTNYSDVCFYITPIGDEESEFRKHSDLFLGSLIEPALEALNIRVVRADKIDQPGMITKQIIDHIVNAKLVIADLSYHNPNVFYELAIRHTLRLPTVQIIRTQDRIPFDVGQLRTIPIDISDIYTFVPKIEFYRAEIASQVRRALESNDEADTPISTFYPDIKTKF